MATPQQLLQQAVDAALAQFDLTEANPDHLRVVPATNPQFGDYQFNGALPLAKILKSKPRDLANQVVASLNVESISETPEIAGPGFINFRLKREFVERAAAEAVNDPRRGVPVTANPQKIVVDYSSPNVAKPMHVGHIRSTIIGDAITRLLRFAGHEVITDNHIGDWGTAFGKIIIGWKESLDENNLAQDPIGEMERLYKLVNAKSEADETVAEQARLETAKLQAGDSENLAIWEKVRELSQREFDAIYERLGVEFDHTLGESFYNPFLEGVVEDLLAKGVATPSEGAVAIFSNHQLDPKEDPYLIFRDGEWQDYPAIVRKRDGAATYATTDLATLDYRVKEWHPNEIIYVTDARQQDHFKQVFNAFQRWQPEGSKAEFTHAFFGKVLGDDGKPIKTRSGENIKLKDLLDEAEARALEVVKAKQPDLSEEQLVAIARVVGISAVKYADLSQNRATDYIFSWDKMLALNGNSAVYLLYAYVRTRSIFRRAIAEGISTGPFPGELVLTEPSELALAKHALAFGEAIEAASVDYRLNFITEYLFQLAQKYTAFFDACPVIKSEGDVRLSRFALCQLTADVLQTGLGLLGIHTIEQM